MTAKFIQPDHTSQDSASYKNNINACISIMARIAAMFAPSAQNTPNMTIAIDSGSLLVGSVIASQTTQNTGTIIAPVSNPRYDLVVIDSVTAAVSVITGTEASVPALPAIPSNKLPVAQISLSVGQSSIINSNITDLRLGSGGGGSSVLPVVTKTAGYAMQTTDVNKIFQANVATANTWSLPSASSVPSGSLITLENIGAGTVTISTAIDGVSNFLIWTGWTIEIYSDGSAWRMKTLSSAQIPVTIPGTNLAIASANTAQSTTSLTAVKKKEIQVLQGGKISTSFQIKGTTGGGTTYGQIYVNGVAAGSMQNTTNGQGSYSTFSDSSISVNAGDLVQVYIYVSSASYTGYLQNFNITCGGVVYPPQAGTVNLN